MVFDRRLNWSNWRLRLVWFKCRIKNLFHPIRFDRGYDANQNAYPGMILR